MLRRPPTNLNKQSQDATVLLIREVLARGIQLSEVSPTFPSPQPCPALTLHLPGSQVYVDALGKTEPYQAYLSSLFPDISFTVTAKADSKFKIVGAASVAAKVTRDAWIEGWVFEETLPQDKGPVGSEKETPAQLWGDELGSGYPSGETIGTRLEL